MNYATVKEALTALDGKGNADAIAEYLTSIECVGTVNDPHSCPVAQYLYRAMDMPGMFEIGTESVTRLEPNFAHAVTFELPTAIQTFIVQFDDGRYPVLIDYGDTDDEWEN